jgi:hypothetical protein
MLKRKKKEKKLSLLGFEPTPLNFNAVRILFKVEVMHYPWFTLKAHLHKDKIKL